MERSVGPVGVGVVGCGRIAMGAHLKALAGSDGLSIAALAEPDPGRRREAGRFAPGAPAYADWREMLEDPAVEAVVVCAPPGVHAEVAAASLEAGRAAYVEKPLATRLADAAAVLGTWRRTGRVGVMGFNLRFCDPYRWAADVIRSGALGEIVGVRSSFCSAPRELPGWKLRRESGGGALLDLASHHVDLIRFLFGEEVVEVDAVIRAQASEADSAFLRLRLASGIPVQTCVAFGTLDEDRLEIYGHRGKAVADRYRGAREILAREHEYSRPAWIRDELRETLRRAQRLAGRLGSRPGEPSYRASLQAFARAVRGGAAFAGASLEDGYRCLAVIEAAERAATEMRPQAPEAPARGEMTPT